TLQGRDRSACLTSQRARGAALDVRRETPRGDSHVQPRPFLSGTRPAQERAIRLTPLLQESREMLGLTDNLRYNGLHHSSATQTRRVTVCVSNFNSSCAAMRVRKRPSPM